MAMFFRSFQTTLQNKNCTLSGIRTRIVRVEGEHADHLTTTTAVLFFCLLHALSGFF